MKKVVLWLFVSLIFSFWAIFAQEILPDEANIEIKNPIIEWEAANLNITMIKNWSKMSSYTWTIIIMIMEEWWSILKPSEYTLPNRGMYTFLASDLWSKEFQKWLEIKKEWNFYIEVEDLNDPEEKTLWRQLIQVVKNWWWQWNVHIDLFNPISNSILTSEKVEVLGQALELPNSNVLVYIDEQIATQTTTDSNGLINHPIPSISQWNHSIRLEIADIEWNIMWTSDTIFFTYTPLEIQWYKDIKIEPENWLMVWDLIEVTVYTDEMVESVRLRLSDRNDDESILLNKVWNWEFSQKVFLTSSWTIDFSLDTTSITNTTPQTYENVKQITVSDVPQISYITVNTDDKNQTAEILWEAPSETIGSYLVSYRLDDYVLTGQEWTNTSSFIFTDVPYDTTIYLNITPYLNEELSKHGTASETIQFIIRKPADESENSDVTTWGTSIPTPDNNQEEIVMPKCTIQNIATRTEKIWDNHYLIWDKVENVSKYIVYSSESASGTDRTKIYETTDTSYEYPFDYTAEEDQFMYFRIVWVCEDGEELELSWATKVQVWPAQDFFLLVCMTLLIYFWIRLFRQTEE